MDNVAFPLIRYREISEGMSIDWPLVTDMFLPHPISSTTAFP